MIVEGFFVPLCDTWEVSEVPPPYVQQPVVQPQPIGPNDENLKLVALFCRILSGILHLVGLFPCFHLVIGIVILVAGKGEERFVGLLFALIGGFMVLLLQSVAGFGWIAAKYIDARQKHTLCIVHACLMMIGGPLGIGYGIFALITLTKPENKAAFTN